MSDFNGWALEDTESFILQLWREQPHWMWELLELEKTDR